MKHLPAKNAFDPVRKGYGQPIEKFGPKGKAVGKLVKGGRALLSVHGRDIPKATSPLPLFVVPLRPRALPSRRLSSLPPPPLRATHAHPPLRHHPPAS